MPKQKVFTRVTLGIIIGLLSVNCAKLGLQPNHEPISGEDISVYNLADGQLEFRVKVTGMTSTLWITADLVNNSDTSLTFDPNTLLQFSDPSCVANNDFEKIDNTSVPSKSFQRFRYSFQLYSKRKNSPEYARCKDKPLHFRVDGLLLGQNLVKPISFSVD